MQCPACGHYDAYTGLQWIHCRNGECRYYDKKYDDLRTREEMGTIELDDIPVPPEETEEEKRLKRLKESIFRRTRP